MAIAIKKLDTLNHCFFTQNQPPSLPRQLKKQWGSPVEQPSGQKGGILIESPTNR